ncbi:hypothetical protein ACQP2T_13510 [Nonomuraea sp. CA-143628]|uniref:hypothetical protein n=1 Tax=Nonomuraea sp. CA-143628 TaxID=3239997 RepID=UPI003D8DA22D
MTTLDDVLAVVGLAAWLFIIAAVAAAGYRQLHPYKVVGYSPATGMVVVRWRDDPSQTHWYTPDHLAQQIGQHR